MWNTGEKYKSKDIVFDELFLGILTIPRTEIPYDMIIKSLGGY